MRAASKASLPRVKELLLFQDQGSFLGTLRGRELPLQEGFGLLVGWLMLQGVCWLMLNSLIVHEGLLLKIRLKGQEGGSSSVSIIGGLSTNI